MAQEGEIEITLKWKNEDVFEMTWKRDNGEIFQITRNEEQGSIKRLWPHIHNLCMDQFTSSMEMIGEDMKS